MEATLAPPTDGDLSSEAALTQLVNAAFRSYHSALALSRSPLANSPLVTPALVRDSVSPTADERGHALRLVLQWAVGRLAPGPVAHPLGADRPYDDPSWRDPTWWRYNILRHRYLEPLHPDEFVEGGRYTETLIALTGIPSPDTFFDERNRAIREVARLLRGQLLGSGEAADLRGLALDAAVRPLAGRPAALALLGIAATFDEVFPRDLLLQIAADERVAGAEAALADLAARRLLLSGDGGASLWLSPVLREYIYQRQPEAARAARHRRAARHYAALEPLAAAGHLQRAGHWEEAARALFEAAPGLVNELQVAELRDLLVRFPPGRLAPDRWRDVQILLSDLLARLGQRDEALAACRRALGTARDPRSQARIYRRMGKLYEQHNQLHALGYYQQALERLAGDDPELPDLLKDQAWVHIWRREWGPAEADLRRALAAAAPADTRADIYDALAVVSLEQQRFPVAVEFGRRALALREEAGSLPRIADSSNNLGLVYNAMGDYTNAIAAYEEALAIYRRLGNRERGAAALLNIGMAHHLAGRREPAIALYEASLAASAEAGLRVVQVRAHYNLAEALAELGRLDEGARHWRAGQELSLAAGFDREAADLAELRERFPELGGPAPGEPAPAAPAPPLDPEALLALDLAAREGSVTPRTLMAAGDVSKATATRRLAELAAQGLLEKRGAGRSTHYVMPGPAAAPPSRLAPELRAALDAARAGLADHPLVAALGAQPGRRPAALRLVVSLAGPAALAEFFALEARLRALVGAEVDLLPAEAAGDDVEWAG